MSAKYLAESGSIDYSAIGSQFVSEGCNVIVGEGFDTANAIQTLAAANPSKKFVLIDDALSKPLPNAVSLVYKTQEAAFLGGYLAAGVTKAKMIGMFGNEPIPPVEDYLNGFYAGVQYYNTKHSASVKTIGWNPTSKTGEFMGSFTDTNKARTITQQELQQGADIVYGVGLPNTVAAAVAQSGGASAGNYMVWVDEDGCPPYPQYCSVQLTSVEKNITPSLYHVLQTVATGTWASGAYNGTLTNDGVGLAPYHDLASKVPASLNSEVQALKASVIAGTVNPDPYAQG
jgi:basic membrane protein A